MMNISKHQWYRRLSLVVMAVAMASGCASVPSPTDQIAVAKLAVANANSAGGTEFAPAEMSMAQDKLDAAVQAMTDEKNIQARLLGEQAQVDAELATAKTHAAKAEKAAVAVEEDNRVLHKELDRSSQ